MSYREEKITLGEKIRFFRKRAQVSQLDLELLANIGEGSICRIEKNVINPSKETLIKIATALDLSAIETGYMFDINLYARSNRFSEL